MRPEMQTFETIVVSFSPRPDRIGHILNNHQQMLQVRLKYMSDEALVPCAGSNQSAFMCLCQYDSRTCCGVLGWAESGLIASTNI